MRRYRVDRRLPPAVRQLYVDTLRARRRDRRDRASASTRPVVGSSGGGVGRLGDRRVATAGPLDRSVHALALDTAVQVVDALTAAGLEPFVVDRDADRIVVGVRLRHREAAIAALATALGEPGWLVRWSDRDRTGLVPLGEAPRTRAVGRSRSWCVFRAFGVGERAIGDDAGVIVNFWTPGTSGQLELVGFRGQDRFDERSPTTVETIDGIDLPGRAAFPVARSLERFAGDVDIVYTWVDGADPAWQDAFRRVAAECGRDLGDESLDPARYRSRDELRYSMRSVWMYCGWVRHIYVVTAGQRPEWLADHPGVTVVDHREILPADGLPTFNSHAIEASLHHIDGLAEHVVYFNDDMFVTRPLRPEAFFHPNGLPNLFQSGARVPGVEDDHTQAVDTAAIRGRELLAERFGRVVESKPYHSPYPLRRSIMAEVESEFPDMVAATRRSRFRSPSDLSTAASFSQQYAFATGRAVLADVRTEYVHVESGRLGWHLDRIRLTDDLQTCCINETRDGATGSVRREQLLADFFRDMYPVAAPWERASDLDDA